LLRGAEERRMRASLSRPTATAISPLAAVAAIEANEAVAVMVSG
jgi:hypothetical protein